MISLRTFAKQTSVWSDSAPFLDVVARTTNTRQIKFAKKIPVITATQAALVAEVGFVLAKRSYEGAGASDSALVAERVKYLRSLPGGRGAGRLGPEGFSEAQGLANNILSFLKKNESSWSFWKEILGSGAVQGGLVDIMSATHLVEVKAVTRPFSPMDLRQAIGYATLLHEAKEPIAQITLLNPRTGYLATMSTEELAFMAAACTPTELYHRVSLSMMGLQVSG